MENLLGFKIPVHEISYFEETTNIATYSLGEYDVRSDTYIVSSWHNLEDGKVLKSKIHATLPNELLGSEIKLGEPFNFRLPIPDKDGVLRKRTGTITLISEGPVIYVVRVGSRTAIAKRIGNAAPAVIIGVGLIALGAVGVVAGAVVAIEMMEHDYEGKVNVGVDIEDGVFGFSIDMKKIVDQELEKKKNEGEDTSGGG